MKIKITSKEKEIFEMIKECRSVFFKDSCPRIAGGWVRDKIMGMECDDMDVALENVSGYEFAAKLEAMFKECTSSVNVIKINPEKSKHLETAVLRIHDMTIDFVNLRNEVYADSRIPTITNGTPEEDAYRRDITINSLFYNLISEEVEDFTNKGVMDIQDRILRTPLEPMTTFEDDPLRILRIFRFRSKLGFSIHEDIYKVLKNSKLKNDLQNKVSKERINIELFKMLSCTYGYLGILEIIKNGYVDVIFKPAKKIDEIRFREFFSKFNSLCSFLYQCDEHKVNELNFEYNLIYKNTKNKWIFNLYIILINYTCMKVKEKKEHFVNYKIAKDSLLCPRNISKIINSIENGISRCKKFDFPLECDSYSINFILYNLEEYWFEIMVLYYCIEGDENVAMYLKEMMKSKTNYDKFYRPIFNVKNLHEFLEIDIKDLKHIITEIKIYQLSYDVKDENEIKKYLKMNIKKILEKYRNLE